VEEEERGKEEEKFLLSFIANILPPLPNHHCSPDYTQPDNRLLKPTPGAQAASLPTPGTADILPARLPPNTTQMHENPSSPFASSRLCVSQTIA
jgi:hypothetical protein